MRWVLFVAMILAAAGCSKPEEKKTGPEAVNLGNQDAKTKSKTTKDAEKEEKKKEEKADPDTWTKTAMPKWAKDFVKSEPDYGRSFHEKMIDELKGEIVVGFWIDLSDGKKPGIVWIDLDAIKKLNRLEKEERMQPVLVGLAVAQGVPDQVHIKDVATKRLIGRFDNRTRVMELP